MSRTEKVDPVASLRQPQRSDQSRKDTSEQTDRSTHNKHGKRAWIKRSEYTHTRRARAHDHQQLKIVLNQKNFDEFDLSPHPSSRSGAASFSYTSKKKERVKTRSLLVTA